MKANIELIYVAQKNIVQTSLYVYYIGGIIATHQKLTYSAIFLYCLTKQSYSFETSILIHILFHFSYILITCNNLRWCYSVGGTNKDPVGHGRDWIKDMRKIRWHKQRRRIRCQRNRTRRVRVYLSRAWPGLLRHDRVPQGSRVTAYDELRESVVFDPSGHHTARTSARCRDTSWTGPVWSRQRGDHLLGEHR